MKERLLNALERIRQIAFGGKMYAKDVDSLMERLDWIIEVCKEEGQSDEEEEMQIKVQEGIRARTSEPR